MIRGFIKKALSAADIRVTRVSRDPKTTLAGLRDLQFQTILDVGANEGQFASYLAKFFPKARFYCFEPLPSVFARLAAWARSERELQVTPINCALGSERTNARMHYHVDHPSSSSFLNATALHRSIAPFSSREEEVTVPVTTLDDLVNEGTVRVAPEILIKLDVQGFEARVIAGGRETFRQARACIVEVCLDALFEGQPKFAEILELLRPLGFEFAGNLEQFCGDDGHISVIDALFLQRADATTAPASSRASVAPASSSC
jgi:FkbM family methyltransferase